MKKFILVLCTILLLCSCSKKEVINYTYELKTKEVDMSVYPGVPSVGHCFKEILPSEFFNAYDAKSSGVFYLGYSSCPFCRQFVRYLNEVALEKGVTVYYMDAYNDYEPYKIGTQAYDRTLEILYDYTDADESGEKCLWTPTVFALVNGEIRGFQIGASYKKDGKLDWTFDNPSKEEVEHLLKIYNEILEPFEVSK